MTEITPESLRALLEEAHGDPTMPSIDTANTLRKVNAVAEAAINAFEQMRAKFLAQNRQAKKLIRRCDRLLSHLYQHSFSRCGGENLNHANWWRCYICYEEGEPKENVNHKKSCPLHGYSPEGDDNA